MIPWILVIPALTLSGGVPGADETRNPGIGDPSWIKEPWSATPPLPVGTGFLGPLCGPGSPHLL